MYVYGRWNRLFGCWQSDERGWHAKTFTPHWPLLDKFGRLAMADADASPIDEYDEGALQELSYYDPLELQVYWGDSVIVDDTGRTSAPDVEDFFQRYSDLIPIELRRIAGAFGSWQWIVLLIIRDMPEFECFLRSELHGKGPGFVAACLALAGANKLSRPEQNELCRRIMFEKRAHLIANLAGEHHGTIALKLLSKLDVEASSAEFRTHLLNITGDPVKSRIASHVRALTFPILWWINQLPSWACSIKLLECLAEYSGGHDLVALCRFVENNCPDQKRNIGRALRDARNGEHLLALVDTLHARLVDKIPFPLPPMAANGRLQPITAARMMRVEASFMRNCLGGLARSVVDGSRYFYRWEGSEPATVCLARNPLGRWELDTALGENNKPLTLKTKVEIEAVLQSVLGRERGPIRGLLRMPTIFCVETAG
jgi:hypothetical protein